MKCWQCGVEPFETFDIRTFGDPDAVYIAGSWPPATDHEHAERPPTPAELAAGGDAALARVLTEWSR
jgi:hypothetical protein